jgi:hypothetical protein
LGIIQSKDDDVVVKASRGYSRDEKVDTASIIVGYRDGSGDHEHIVFNETTGDLISDSTGSIDQ